ncbi:hypothetical protein EV426DRAFT_721276 [Tirmania nivea]|nr:hypothetical protein EV426DRAFT_721276 [Tirmania nivea]
MPSQHISAWSRPEAERLIAWMEENQEELRGKQITWHKLVKGQVFADEDHITVKRIMDKATNMKRSWKDARAMQQRSGWGVKPENNEASINEALERKCAFFWRLDEIWGSSPQDLPHNHSRLLMMMLNIGIYESTQQADPGNEIRLIYTQLEFSVSLGSVNDDKVWKAQRLYSVRGGINCNTRFETGNLKDLESAIGALLNNLGIYLKRRYERTGNLQDLEAAIEHANTALEATPEDHPNRTVLLSNLGNSLNRRFERIGNLQGLETDANAALETTPQDYPKQAGLLDTLSNSLSSQYGALESAGLGGRY